MSASRNCKIGRTLPNNSIRLPAVPSLVGALHCCARAGAFVGLPPGPTRPLRFLLKDHRVAG